MFNLVFFLFFSMASTAVDFTDPTKPQFGGPVGSAAAADGNMVKALDGNPTL
jgi:hypothetical protein